MKFETSNVEDNCLLGFIVGVFLLSLCFTSFGQSLANTFIATVSCGVFLIIYGSHLYRKDFTSTK